MEIDTKRDKKAKSDENDDVEKQKPSTAKTSENKQTPPEKKSISSLSGLNKFIIQKIVTLRTPCNDWRYFSRGDALWTHRRAEPLRPTRAHHQFNFSWAIVNWFGSANRIQTNWLRFGSIVRPERIITSTGFGKLFFSLLNCFQCIPVWIVLGLMLCGLLTLLVLALPVAEIVIGSLNAQKCAINPRIPVFLIVFGAFPLIVIFLSIVCCCVPDENLVRRFLQALASLFMFIWLILGKLLVQESFIFLKKSWKKHLSIYF